MCTKRFNIDGREYEMYQLSNRQLLDLIKDDNISNDDRNLLMGKVLDRFEYDLCPRSGETNDEVFVRSVILSMVQCVVQRMWLNK